MNAREMVELCGLKKMEIARRLGMTPSYVTRGIQSNSLEFRIRMSRLIKSIRIDRALDVADLAAEYAPELGLDLKIFQLIAKYDSIPCEGVLMNDEQ